MSSGPKLLFWRAISEISERSSNKKKGRDAEFVQGEGRVDHAVEQCAETAGCARDKIPFGRTGILPQ